MRFIHCVIFFFLLFVFGCTSNDRLGNAYITGDYVRLRFSPKIEDDNFHEPKRLMKQDIVELVKRSTFEATLKISGNEISDYWYWIRTSEGLEGWIFGKYIEPIVESPIAAPGVVLPPPPDLHSPSIRSNEDKHWLEKVKEKATDMYKEQTGTSDEKYLLDLIKACNFEDELVRNTSAEIAGVSPGSFNLGQVCEFYDHCREEWRYVNDPASTNYEAKASETLQNSFSGDCDDYAVMIASMVLAVGGEAHIYYAYGNRSAHAFTEVNLGSVDVELVKRYLSIRYKVKNITGIRRDEYNHYWLNLDWFSDYPGGRRFPYNKGTGFDILRKKMYSI